MAKKTDEDEKWHYVGDEFEEVDKKITVKLNRRVRVFRNVETNEERREPVEDE